eukprot:6620324-Alexandrium_andersonii.AAC.1
MDWNLRARLASRSKPSFYTLHEMGFAILRTPSQEARQTTQLQVGLKFAELSTRRGEIEPQG